MTYIPKPMVKPSDCYWPSPDPDVYPYNLVRILEANKAKNSLEDIILNDEFAKQFSTIEEYRKAIKALIHK